MILCLGPTPAAQRVMVFRSLKIGAVNRAMATLDGAAGKAVNVAKVLKALGERPLVVGFLGGSRGHELLATLRDKSIAADFANVAAPTRQCITVIDEATGEQTELVEESHPVNHAAYKQLLSIVRRRLPKCRAVVMSGTITPGGPPDLYQKCVQWGNRAGALTIVDATGPALLKAIQAKPALAKPNRLELALTLQSRAGVSPVPDTSRLSQRQSVNPASRRIRGKQDPSRDLHQKRGGRDAHPTRVLAGMRELFERGAQRVVVTAGKDAVFAFDGNKSWRIRPARVPVVNSIGCGDAFTAGLVCRLLRGDELYEACRWAAATAAANALTLMPGEIEPAAVKRLVKQVCIEHIRD